MRRNIIDNVEIVEPPLEELTKKRTGIKHACIFGCFFLVLIVVGLIVFVRIFAGPGPKTLSHIPDNFPKDIPIYDPDSLEKISYISGKYKSRSIEMAAVVPKIILSPMLITLNQDTSDAPATTEKQNFKNIWKIITTPVGDHRDTIQIEWKNLGAEPSFVISYYKTELRKKGFNIDVESKDTPNEAQQFSFSHPNGITGSLYAKGNSYSTPGSEYAILTVNLAVTPSPPPVVKQ